ncbi:thioredoxin family protein [Gracilimonas sp. Q87]|uniref:thioredoxin family protein n=1 Tax=Gracilimonas sp. Q87 TaxID=3384766 RepID=UPI0039844529
MAHIKNLFVAVFLIAAFSSFAQAQTDNSQSEDMSAREMFDWVAFDEAKEKAKEDNKKILVYVNARWCGYCKKMENEVFAEESIQELTSEYFYPVWLDLDVEDEYLTFAGTKLSHRDFAQKLGAYSTPTFIFFEANEDIIAGQPGFLPEDIYSTILRFVGTGAYQDQSFTEFNESK